MVVAVIMMAGIRSGEIVKVSISVPISIPVAVAAAVSGVH